MHKPALLAALVAFAIPSVVLACEAHRKQAQKPAVKKLSVGELAKLQSTSKPTLLDANGPKTRKSQGVIPGAVLLTSSSRYDVAKELPATKDSKLVFYCANEKCTASQTAAERALSSGYTDVAILPAGIQGWKSSGQKTAIPQS